MKAIVKRAMQLAIAVEAVAITLLIVGIVGTIRSLARTHDRMTKDTQQISDDLKGRWAGGP